eukprot:gene9533-12841_t
MIKCLPIFICGVVVVNFVAFTLFHYETGVRRRLLFSRKTCLPKNQTLDTNSLDYYRPKCFQRWIDQDSKYIISAMHRNINYNKLVYDTKSDHSRRADSSNGWQLGCRFNSLIADLHTNRVKYFHHFPHFSEVYFNFISIVIWQRDAFQIQPNMTACINSIAIDDKAKNVWSIDSLTHDWIRDLIGTVERHWQVKTISSLSCAQSTVNPKNKKVDISSWKSIENAEKKMINEYSPNSPQYNLGGWFMHASDAYSVGSLILKTDPCQLQGQADQLVQKNNPIQLMILDRHSERKILNYQDILDLVTSDSHFSAYNFKIEASGNTNFSDIYRYPMNESHA